LQSGKLLVDPYAKSISGDIEWNDAVFPYPLGGDDLQRDDARQRAVCSEIRRHRRQLRLGRRPRALDGSSTRPSSTKFTSKGFSKLRNEIPKHSRGTYAGLAHPASIDYLTSLGVDCG
jgi:glycogen operon protein